MLDRIDAVHSGPLEYHQNVVSIRHHIGGFPYPETAPKDRDCLERTNNRERERVEKEMFLFERMLGVTKEHSISIYHIHAYLISIKTIKIYN